MHQQNIKVCPTIQHRNSQAEVPASIRGCHSCCGVGHLSESMKAISARTNLQCSLCKLISINDPGQIGHPASVVNHCRHTHTVPCNLMKLQYRGLEQAAMQC